MRTIKFRGKRLSDNKWVYGFFNGIDQAEDLGEVVCIKDSDQRYNFCNKETLGQFTGRCDKNGIEIYESDIVKSYSQYECIDGIKTIFTEPRLVKFEFERWYPFADDDYEYGTWWPKLTENCEVIGNVYDNPELLRGEK